MMQSATGAFLDSHLDQDLLDNANIRLNSIDIFSSQSNNYNLAQLVSIQNLIAKLHKAGVLGRDDRLKQSLKKYFHGYLDKLPL